MSEREELCAAIRGARARFMRAKRAAQRMGADPKECARASALAEKLALLETELCQLRERETTMNQERQVSDWIADLSADRDRALRQAEEGPFYPERGITAESLRAYADAVQKQIEDPRRSLHEALRGSR